MGYYERWPEYVSVAQKKAKIESFVRKKQKKGAALHPIVVNSKKLTTTFWGKAWCDNLKNYSDYENRLPRGRSYVRHGAVIDLKISKGLIEAQVMGSSLYSIVITTKPLLESKWRSLVSSCSGKIDSLVELLQGKFSKAVMSLLVDKDQGLFPSPKEMEMSCSCPDHAELCKHLAAVLYGIGVLLDQEPEKLFLLRHVEHLELLSIASKKDLFLPEENEDSLEEKDLSELFGIEIEKKEKRSSKKKRKKR